MELINKYAKEIAGKLGEGLEALILVGSFSRGEGVEGVSDIEFWAVVKDLSAVKKPELAGNLSLGLTTRNHLKRLKPYIYTVEVKKFGKVLSGDKDILKLIPDYSYADIKPIDGFILLNNRIVEQLILLSKINDGQTINQYDFDKGYIQLVNSLLVLNRRYKSLYPEKQEEFKKIDSSAASLPQNDKDDGLLNKIEEAFASINNQRSGIASAPTVPRNDVNREETLKKWLELREYFKKVWVDEKKFIGNLMCLIKVLNSGKPIRFFVYQKSVGLYFSEEYQNKTKRDNVIKNWKRFVK